MSVILSLDDIRSQTPQGYRWSVEVESSFGFYQLVIRLENLRWSQRVWEGDVWTKRYNIDHEDNPDDFEGWVLNGCATVLEERAATLGYHGTDWAKLAKEIQDRLNGK